MLVLSFVGPVLLFKVLLFLLVARVCLEFQTYVLAAVLFQGGGPCVRGRCGNEARVHGVFENLGFVLLLRRVCSVWDMRMVCRQKKPNLQKMIV